MKYAKGIVGDAASAEDVVQEAYIRFSGASEKVVALGGEPIVHPLAYLYGIVRNLALSWVQRSSVDVLVRRDNDELASIASDAPLPEAVLLHRDELRVLLAALSNLPDRTRLAFNMNRMEGVSLQEVANRLGVSLSRAHQLVKTALIHATKSVKESKR